MNGRNPFDEIVHRNFADRAVSHGMGRPDQMFGILVGVATTTGQYYFKFGEVPLYQGDKPVATEDIVMCIASNTKVFTATLLALAQLTQTPVEARLNTDVTDLLPPGTAIKFYENYPIKLWHLATHSAAYPHPLCGQKTVGDYTFDQLTAFLSAFQPQYQPGTAYHYSDVGFALLGDLLSHAYTPPSAGTCAVWGTTYQQWPGIVTSNILKPLGMTSTQTGYAGLIDRLAQPYSYYQTTYASGFVPVDPPDFVTGSAGLGAGSLCSTLYDMLLFLENQMALNLADTLGQAIALTQVPPAHDTLAMGLGWQMGNNFFYKNGLLTGSASFMAFDPVNCVAVVAMANSEGNKGVSLADGCLGTLGDLRGYAAVPYGRPLGVPEPTCPNTAGTTSV